MIPKIIHWCWFGDSKMPMQLSAYQASWQKHLSGYEFRKWDEESFELTQHNFLRSALEHGAWAFAADYARAWALSQEGGIYLDTDIEIHESLDQYLTHAAFTGFEKKGSPFTAVWGSTPQHSLALRVLGIYNNLIYDPELKMELINTKLVSKLITEDYLINPNLDEKQEGKDGLVVYPSTTFCLDLPRNSATHHFFGSWDLDPSNYAPYIMDLWHQDNFLMQFDKFSEEEIGSLGRLIFEKIGPETTADILWNSESREIGVRYLLNSISSIELIKRTGMTLFNRIIKKVTYFTHYD